VDNYTASEEVHRLRELASRHGWELVALPENAGFGAGATQASPAHGSSGAMRSCSSTRTSVADAEVLRALIAHVRREPTALVSPTIRRPDGRVWFAGGDLLLERGTTAMVSVGGKPAGEPWVPGTCLAVHEQLWERLAGFDDAYFLYWEDVDLSHRCLAAGGPS
jgi:GT2 family glycosyltransferase